MTAMTNYLEDAVLNHLVGGSPLAQPGALYLGLLTGDPTDSGSVASEISGNAYARIVISFGVVGAGQVVNDVDVLFAVATPAAWGLLTHAGIFDAVSGGNMLYHAALAASKNIGIGDQFKISIGELVLSAD